MASTKIVTAADAVAKSRARTGSKPVAITMRPDEAALLDDMAARHGGRKAAVMAGLEALKRGAPEPTPEEALRVLTKIVKGRGR